MTPPEPAPVAEIIAERERARREGDPLVDACFLATVDAAGQPAVRTIILRDVCDDGFGLLISSTSPKYQQLGANGRSELLLLWHRINRQYRIQGHMTDMPAETVAGYWQRKSHGSRLLDHYYTSFEPQSAPIPSREHFMQGIEALKERWPNPEDIPVAPALKGLYLVPSRIETWHGSPADRLHDRRLYTRAGEGGEEWTVRVLVP